VCVCDHRRRNELATLRQAPSAWHAQGKRENTQVAKPNDSAQREKVHLAASLLQGRQRERGATCGQLSAMRLLAVPAGLPHVELLERCVENGFPFRQLTACGVVVEYKCSCRVTHLSCCALCLSRHRPLAARTLCGSVRSRTTPGSPCAGAAPILALLLIVVARAVALHCGLSAKSTQGLGPCVMSHTSIRSKGETQSCPHRSARALSCRSQSEVRAGSRATNNHAICC